MKSKKIKSWLIPLIIIVLLMGGFFLYTANYYHADDIAKNAMISDDNVNVIKTDYGWLFDGASDEYGLIFFPGGKVETSAYAPICRALAMRGIDVCLVDMPFHLAIFGGSAVNKAIETSDYNHLYIGGHSLGGAISSYYLDRDIKFDGIIFLASYPNNKIDDDIKTTFIYGSEDKVLNMKSYYENRGLAPADSIEHIIIGGNHAQFGSYGPQSGDGTALISSDKQIEETADDIVRDVLQE